MRNDSDEEDPSMRSVGLEEESEDFEKTNVTRTSTASSSGSEAAEEEYSQDEEDLEEQSSVDSDESEDKKRKKLFLGLGIAAVLVILIAIITGAVCVSGVCGEKVVFPTVAPTLAPTEFKYTTRPPAKIVTVPPHQSAPKPKPPTKAPTPPPPEDTGLDRDAVELNLGGDAYITLPAHSAEARWQTANSPQAQAEAWLRLHPELPEMENWRKQQLFALATLQFSQIKLAPLPNAKKRLLQEGEEDQWLDANTPECQWKKKSIKCKDKKVTKASFILGSSNSLPPEIQLLSDLKELTVRGQEGQQQSIPFEYLIPNQRRWGIHKHGKVGFLGNLTRLTLIQSTLSGTIPGSIKSLLPNLVHLDVSNNRLVGRMPNGVLGFEQIQHLDLSSNALTGPIPTEHGYPTSLTHLYLNDNQLNGTIPDLNENAEYEGLLEVKLHHNQLFGRMPFGFCDLRRAGPFACVYDTNCLEQLWADCGEGGGVECSKAGCCNECFSGETTADATAGAKNNATMMEEEEEVVDQEEREEIQDSDGTEEEEESKETDVATNKNLFQHRLTLARGGWWS